MSGKQVIIFFGIISMIEIIMTFVLTFIFAYLSPSKQIIVTINSIGEANLELVLIVISIPCIIYCIYLLFKQLGGDMYERETRRDTQKI